MGGAVLVHGWLPSSLTPPLQSHLHLWERRSFQMMRPSVRLLQPPSSSAVSALYCIICLFGGHLPSISPFHSAFALSFCHLPALSRLAALVLFVYLGDFCRTAAALRNFASPYFVLRGILNFFSFFLSAVCRASEPS